MRRLIVLVPLAIAAIAAGCGSDSGDDGGASSGENASAAVAETASKAEESTAKAGNPAAATSKAPKGTRVKIVGSQFGRVVADGKGEALYLFDKERGKKPRCYGTCARVWPPLLTKGKPRAGKGAKASLLGTTRRANGKLQVTYAGHPLYYYVDDEPGLIVCHDVEEFGGLWLVVKPNGQPA